MVNCLVLSGFITKRDLNRFGHCRNLKNTVTACIQFRVWLVKKSLNKGSNLFVAFVICNVAPRRT